MPFIYSGYYSPIDTPYTWDLGNAHSINLVPYWPLTITPSGLSCYAIYYKFLVNNSDFQSEHGIVRLNDSSNHSTLSTDPAPNANKKVQVFYQKAETKYWNLTEPNCLYYWKQFVNKKKIAEQHFKTHEQLKLIYKSDKPIACVHPISDRKCYYRQLATEETGYTCNKGILTFIEALSHENHHIALWNYLWSHPCHPNNSSCHELIYAPIADRDPDYYSPWLELSTYRKKYFFDPKDDSGIYHYKIIAYSESLSSEKIYKEIKYIKAQNNVDAKTFDSDAC